MLTRDKVLQGVTDKLSIHSLDNLARVNRINEPRHLVPPNNLDPEQTISRNMIDWWPTEMQRQHSEHLFAWRLSNPCKTCTKGNESRPAAVNAAFQLQSVPPRLR